MAAVGGRVSNSILPYINYAQLRKTPKIIIGHSDVTAILLGVYQMTGILPTMGQIFSQHLGSILRF